ncbi:MAG TPA: hypothetical protein VNO33_20615, partial [Kofleriaceae bacterium]|nr:hypothetical protein [Kofleriaceae bacterium]
ETEEASPGRGWRIAFWSGVLATGVAGGGWVYSGVSVQSKENDKIEQAISDYEHPQDAELLPDSVRQTDGTISYPKACASFEADTADASNDSVRAVRNSCDRGQRHAALVNWVWIPATAAAALFTGFALYKGYIAPGGKSSSEREARRRRSRPRVTVTPALGPNLVGAGLELQF